MTRLEQVTRVVRELAADGKPITSRAVAERAGSFCSLQTASTLLTLLEKRGAVRVVGRLPEDNFRSRVFELVQAGHGESVSAGAVAGESR